MPVYQSNLWTSEFRPSFKNESKEQAKQTNKWKQSLQSPRNLRRYNYLSNFGNNIRQFVLPCQPKLHLIHGLIHKKKWVCQTVFSPAILSDLTISINFISINISRSYLCYRGGERNPFIGKLLAAKLLYFWKSEVLYRNSGSPPRNCQQ